MKLLLADDHTLFRDALLQYITRAESGAQVTLAKDLDEAFRILEKDKNQDLILLDLKMPGMNGLEGLKKICESYPDIPIGLMSGVAEREDVQKAMDMGAVGYFPKTLSGKSLLTAIQQVLAGQTYIPFERGSTKILPSYYEDVIEGQVEADVERPSGSGESTANINLTPRETEVLTYLGEGASNKEIANALNLQVVTVKLHVRGVCRKLGAKNRTQAALRARELGLTG